MRQRPPCLRLPMLPEKRQQSPPCHGIFPPAPTVECSREKRQRPPPLRSSAVPLTAKARHLGSTRGSKRNWSALSPASSVSRIEARCPFSRGQSFVFVGEFRKILTWARNGVVITSPHRRTRVYFILMPRGIRHALLMKGNGRAPLRRFSPVLGGTCSCATITLWVRASFNLCHAVLLNHQSRGRQLGILPTAKPRGCPRSKRDSFIWQCQMKNTKKIRTKLNSNLVFIWSF